jgi:hypothetical protein
MSSRAIFSREQIHRALATALLISMVLPLFTYSGSAASKEFQVQLESGDEYWGNSTLENAGDINSYFISTQGHRGIGVYINVENASFGNLTIRTLRGLSTNGTDLIPGLSSQGNTTREVWSHYIEKEDSGELTIMLTTDQEDGLDYTFYFTVWGFKDQSSGTSLTTLVIAGLLGIGLLTTPYIIWVIKTSPKYKLSFRTVRFSPEEDIHHPIPLGTGLNRSSQGNLVRKGKYVTQKGSELSTCPFCRKTLGNKKNRFFYSSLSFTDVYPIPDDYGNPQYRTWLALSVYCQSCNRVLGVTKQ